MSQSIYKTFVIIFLIPFLSRLTIGQDNKQHSTQDQIYYSETGCVNDPQLTTIQPPPKQFSAEKTKIIAELRQARLNHYWQKKEKLEARLNEIENTIPVVSYLDGSIQSSGPINQEIISDNDYNYSLIANLPHWNHAVAMVHGGSLNGRIYVAVGVYASYPNSDTVKVYLSTNGGVSWVWQYSWWMPGLNMDCRSNEMDITILYDGTTAWLYGVTPINNIANNNTRTILWRRNLTTHEFYYITLYWPGSPTTNLDYNARLASDDAIYNSYAYLYITVASDSIYSGGHYLRQKFARVSDPFATPPPIDYLTGGNWWWGTWTTGGVYAYNDVTYIHPSTDRVFTLLSWNIIYSDMYLAWSDDWGATVSGFLRLTETTPTSGSSFASVVAIDYPRMMIVHKKYVSGSNWDVEYHYTTNGGTTAGSWTNGFIENTSYKSSGYPNVTWVRTTLNNFKAAYTLDSGGITRPFYAGWNGSAWNSPSRMAVGNLQADSTNACPVAGYSGISGDNCLAIWSNFYPIYASIRCITTVGINGNNNGIPEIYSLSQNYPNPFNPVTTIKFDIPKHGLVKLTVYDIWGKEIESLANEEKEPGSYTVIWDASKCASGVYFYELVTGEYKESKKMILIR